VGPELSYRTCPSLMASSTLPLSVLSLARPYAFKIGFIYLMASDIVCCVIFNRWVVTIANHSKLPNIFFQKTEPGAGAEPAPAPTPAPAPIGRRSTGACNPVIRQAQGLGRMPGCGSSLTIVQ